MYIILGNSSFVKARNGYDLSSFSIELYLGLCCLIKCLSSMSASCGELVTMHSMSSEFLTKSGIIARSGFEAKYDLIL